jgi:hypothetical protein
VIPKEIADAAAAKHREWSHCVICGCVISGPSLACEGSRYAHLGCVDWAARDYPGRDLAKRLRSLRWRLEELATALEAAERVADKIEDGWPAHARARAEAYFRLVDRVRAAIYRATGGW